MLISTRRGLFRWVMVTGFRKAAAMMSPDRRERSLVEYSASGTQNCGDIQQICNAGRTGRVLKTGPEAPDCVNGWSSGLGRYSVVQQCHRNAAYPAYAWWDDCQGQLMRLRRDRCFGRTNCQNICKIERYAPKTPH